MKLPARGTPEREQLAEMVRQLLVGRTGESVSREIGVSRGTIRDLVRGDRPLPSQPREILHVGEVPKCGGCGLRLFTKKQQADGTCGTCPRIDDYAGMRRERV